MHFRIKRNLVIVLTALAAAAFAGGALAASKSSSANPRRAFLDDVAKRLHVTPAQLNAALKGAAADQLQSAVKAGKLSQAQANKLKQRIQNHAGAGPLLFGPPRGQAPFGPPRGAVPFGAPRGLRPFGLHHALFFGPHAPAKAAANYLGLTRGQLRKQLASGKSLAQIAKAQGKSTSGLEQAITAAIKARLDKAVANKRLTATQEKKLLSRLSAGIDDLVNATPPRGLRAFKGPHAFGFHRFRGGFVRPGSFAPKPGSFAPAPPPLPAGPTA
jgi:hypothetical protein